MNTHELDQELSHTSLHSQVHLRWLLYVIITNLIYNHALYIFKDKAWEIPEAELEFSQAEVATGISKYGVSIF